MTTVPNYFRFKHITRDDLIFVAALAPTNDWWLTYEEGEPMPTSFPTYHRVEVERLLRNGLWILVDE